MRRSILFGGLLLFACGSEPAQPPGPPPAIFPLAVGNGWTYRIITSRGVEGDKVQTTTATVAPDGSPAVRLSTVRGADETISINGTTAERRVVRFSEVGQRNGAVRKRIRFEPFDVRVDLARTALGEQYEVAFDEVEVDASGAELRRKSVVQRYVVEAVDEEVTVPAGSFRTVRLRRDTVGGSSKQYWYAFGVGKVKEAGGQLEELVSYEIRPEE